MRHCRLLGSLCPNGIVCDFAGHVDCRHIKWLRLLLHPSHVLAFINNVPPLLAAAERLVCVCSCAPADPKTGEEVRGICSNYLADVKPGDELVMTGPAGTALLLADNPWAKRIVCVSTGTPYHTHN